MDTLILYGSRKGAPNGPAENSIATTSARLSRRGVGAPYASARYNAYSSYR